MQAFEIQNAFGLDNLNAVEQPIPEPGPGEVLIRLKACSLNYRDLLMVLGHYNPNLPLPLRPLSDGVGEVTACGEGVDRVKIGDRVAGIFTQLWLGGRLTYERARSALGGERQGMLAEYVVLNQDGVVKLPERLSYIEAATLPCAALTAWNALMVSGGLTAGETVLIQGTGGVSLFGLQIAKIAGARVIITSSSDEKLERARAMGADETINYRDNPKWAKIARQMTDGNGVDHIIEVGGGQTLGQSLKACTIGGHIAMIGILGGNEATIHPTDILMHGICVQGIMVGSRDMFEAMNAAIEVNGLTPQIDREFHFTEIVPALQHLQSGSHFGKIVLNF